MRPVPDNAGGTWDLIVVPWHLDEHIPDFPVPVGAAATIDPPLPAKEGGEAGAAIPGRMTVLHRTVADAVAGAARPLLLSGTAPPASPLPPGSSGVTPRSLCRLRSFLLRSPDGQRTSLMRIRVPAGSRKAQSRMPYGCSVGSWTTSAPPASSRSKVASRSLVASVMQA
jgi:hypothetical protein